MRREPLVAAAPVKQALGGAAVGKRQPVGACLASTSPGAAATRGNEHHAPRLDCPIRANGDRGPRA